MKYVSCDMGLPNGVTPGKRYPITEDGGASFSFIDDEGDERYCLRNGCAHLANRKGASWSFHDNASDLELKVGDRVRILSGGYALTDTLQNGMEFDIVHVNGGLVYADWADHGSRLAFHTYEVEPVNTDIASLTIDIPTSAMKEFADHCERAAAALERIRGGAEMKFEPAGSAPKEECVAYIDPAWGLVYRGQDGQSVCIYNDGSGIEKDAEWQPDRFEDKFYPGDKITITF